MNIVTSITGSLRADERYAAIDDDTYCGCEDCHCPVGLGASEKQAIADLIEQLTDDEQG